MLALVSRLVALLGCAAIALPAVAAEVQIGVASWYGPGFHGRLTASGERYDQNAATCAHLTFRFGTVLRVLNLDNRRSATCRVTDRGPYVAGRVIDLSRGTAMAVGMITSGTARVRITVLSTAPPTRRATTTAIARPAQKAGRIVSDGGRSRHPKRCPLQ